jgi:plastocyanin
MANHTVTLNVDTSVNLTPQNVDDYSNFGQSSGSNENFNTVVNVGDTVTWQGLSSTQPSVTVNVTKIQKNGGSDVFGASVINGSGNPETVVGTVQNNTNSENEEYSIFFNVSNQNGTFNIDPKISVNP